MFVLAVLVIVSSRITLNEYALTPGDAQPVDPLVTVPPAKVHRVHGQILLTDVFVAQLTLLEYLPYRWNPDAQLVPGAELLDPDTPAGQLTDQGYLEMAQSQSFAKAAAFRRLGYGVPEQNAGTVMYAVKPGSPGSSTLDVGDIVTAVGATPTPDTCAFIGALSTSVPGQKVQLTVTPVTFNNNGVPVRAKTVHKTVRLGKPPAGGAASGCPGLHGPSPVYLGVEIETQQDFTYPFPTSIDTAQIGGPSAGLAMTLGLLDKLTSGSLTGGEKIAATGTIDAAGNVGDVGGVAQKTVAVENAGARVFFVPPEELAAAKSKGNASLHIYAVSTLDQALTILGRLGGHVPPKPPAAAAPPKAP